jgi:uncharacterized protein involved in cysteine biosynthesis
MLLSIVAMAATAAAIARFWSGFHGFITGLVPSFEAATAWAWLWVGPANALFWLVGWIGVVVALAGAFVLAFLVASIAASPFLDALSSRVERIVTGAGCETGDRAARSADARPPGIAGEGVASGAPWSAWNTANDTLRIVLDEARRTVFFLGMQGLIVLAGILLPGGALLAPPLLAVFTMLFLPLDFASFALDRRRVPFAERRRWVRVRMPLMLGFGATGFSLSLVPGLNFLAMPVFVVAGTLLVLRAPPSATPIGDSQPVRVS